MNTILIISTLLIVSAIILVVAFHLIGIFWYLKKTGDNLESLAGGLTQITSNTNPLEKNIDDLKQLMYSKVREIHVTRFPYNNFLYPEGLDQY